MATKKVEQGKGNLPTTLYFVASLRFDSSTVLSSRFTSGWLACCRKTIYADVRNDDFCTEMDFTTLEDNHGKSIRQLDNVHTRCR